jgi:putative ABC transport system permease protein
MKLKYFNLAIKNLKKRKLRSTLTMIGIIVSIATIFTLVSLSLGLQYTVEEQFRLLGSDKIFIQPSIGFLSPPGTAGSVILTEEDVKFISKIDNVKDVSYFVAGSGEVEYSNVKKYLAIWGLPPESQSVYIETGSFKIEEGRFLEKGDRNSVVLGNNFKTKNLLGRPLSSGNKIIINGISFKVRGIMETIGNPEDDSAILMDLDSFREIFDTQKRVDYIIVQIEESADPILVGERIESQLRKFRGVTEKTQDFNVLTPEELLNSFQNILNIITYFLAGVSAISLLIGAIGIANTMYTSVIERTREIGIMKAIGAKNSDITWIFLIESGLLGLIGAGIGVLLGIGVSKLIESIAINQLGINLLQVALPLWLIAGCLGFGFLIGSISGTFPAIQASKVKVINALHYE